jgi:hypothetical protein
MFSRITFATARGSYHVSPDDAARTAQCDRDAHSVVCPPDMTVGELDVLANELADVDARSCGASPVFRRVPVVGDVNRPAGRA